MLTSLRNSTDVLPADVTARALEYADVVSLARCVKVCRVWRECGCRMRLYFFLKDSKVNWRSIRWGHVSDSAVRQHTGQGFVVGMSATNFSNVLQKLMLVLVTEAPYRHQYRSSLGVASKTPTATTPGLFMLPNPEFRMESRAAVHLLCYNLSGPPATYRCYYRRPRVAPCIVVGIESGPPNPETAELWTELSNSLNVPHVRVSIATAEGVSELLGLISEQCARVADERKKLPETLEDEHEGTAYTWNMIQRSTRSCCVQ